MKLSENLKLLRTQKKLNQRDLAKILHISQPGYAKYENDLAEPNINMLIELAELYGVTVDYLLGNENLPQKTSGALETVTPEKAKEIWFASLPSATQILINQILQLDDFQKVRVSTFAMTLLAGGQ